MDGQVGEIMDTLKSTGQDDHTLVLFSSEQGSQFPGANGRLGIPDCTPPWLPVGLEKLRRGSVPMHWFSMPIYCPHCWTWLAGIPPDLTERALAEY
jgi:arylsulfatase A-like enzyme